MMAPLEQEEVDLEALKEVDKRNKYDDKEGKLKWQPKEKKEKKPGVNKNGIVIGDIRADGPGAMREGEDD